MHPEHQRKSNELIGLIASNMKILVNRLYHSGGIDPDSYNPDEYRLAKILVTAAIRDSVDIFSPCDASGIRDLKNLERF